MDPTEMLALARRSLMSATERMADLLATAPDVDVPAHRCEWSLREVAAHFITGTPMFTDMANGIPGPAVSLEKAYVKDFCERRIADVSERDPVKLSRLLLDGMEDFLDTTVDRPGDDPIIFQAGLPHTLFGLVGILLGEVLLHGYDMATALGRPWPIDAGDAALVLAAYTPLLAVCGDGCGTHQGADRRRRDRTPGRRGDDGALLRRRPSASNRPAGRWTPPSQLTRSPT